MTPFDLHRLPARFEDAETIDIAIQIMREAGFDRRMMESMLIRRAPVDLDLLAERLDLVLPEHREEKRASRRG